VSSGNDVPKLDREQVEEIKRRYEAGGVTKAELGREFGISDVQVGRIIRGARWTTEGAVARR
jgi:DNA invertase Pin-like site-specific DNA recombinase